MQEAFKSGRKAEAKQLSDKGKQEGKLMDDANQKASDAVFHEKNTGRDDHTVDLHGLYVEEAVNRARQAIQQAKREVRAVKQCLALPKALNMALIQCTAITRTMTQCKLHVKGSHAR